MSGEARATGETRVEGAEGQPDPKDPVALGNALRFEQAKNQVLLEQVVALEEEIVNRCMDDFDAVVSDETREFWREQLLTNRDGAMAALGELAQFKAGRQTEPTPAAGHPSREGTQSWTRRPLHNRAAARPDFSFTSRATRRIL